MTRSDGTISEAFDAASGGLLFGAFVVVAGGLVALADWAVGNYPTVGIVFGCAILSTLVASAVWGVLHWGIDEPMTVQPTATRKPDGAPFKQAA